MTLSVKQGTFTKDTSTSVPVSQDITGLGFTPSCIWMWTEASTGTSFENDCVISYGFSDGSANGCISYAVKRVVSGNSNTAGSIRDDSCVCILDASGTPTNVLARGKVTGFSSGQVSFQWDANTAVASIIHYMVIGGTDITNVKVLSTTTGTTSTGNKGYTGVGFLPDFAQCINGSVSQTTINVTSTAWIYAIGTAISTTKRWVMAGNSEHAVVTSSDTYSYQEIAKFMGSYAPATGTTDLSADFVSFDSDGLTVNYTDAPDSSTQRLIFLCIKGGLWDIGSFQKKTSTGTQDVAITVARDPQAVMMHSLGASTSSSGAAAEAFTACHIGGSDGTTEGVIWSGDSDASATGTTTRVTKTDKAIGIFTENATAASSTTNGAADMNNMTTTGRFQLNWTTSDAGAFYIHYWCLSELGTDVKLYLHDTTSGLPSGTLPSAEQSTKTVTAACNFEGSQTTNRLMDSTIGASQATLTLVSPGAAGNYTYYVSRWVSPVIYQTSVAAGDWTYNFAARESTTSGNYPVTSSNKAVWVNCYVWKPSDGTKYGTILDGNTAATVTEGSSNQERSQQADFTGAAVSSLTSGDACVVFEAWFVTSPNVGSVTNDFFYDGTTETAAGSTVTNHASYIKTLGMALSFTPTTTQVNQTFTHQYKIALLVSQTRTHIYKIIGRIIQTYTHKYKIRALVNATKTHIYKIRALVNRTRTHIYKIVGRVAKTYTHIYKIIGRAFQTYTHKYNIKLLVSTTKTHIYKIVGRVVNTYTHLYKIRALVNRTRTHIYKIVGRASQVFTHLYKIRQLASQIYTHLYKIRAIVNRTRTHIYKIVGRATQTFTHLYKIRLLVTQTYTHLYKLRQLATQTHTHIYKIIGRASQTFTHKYRILILATQTFTHKYKLRQLAIQTFTHIYKIISEQLVANRAFTHIYKIVGRTTQTYTHKYNIKLLVNKVFTHIYKLRLLVSVAKTFLYKIRQLTSQTFTHKYKITQLVNATKTFLYKIIGRTSQTYTHRYNIKQLVNQIKTFKYNILVLVNQSYTHRYRIALLVSQTFTHSYNLLELVSNTFTHIYKIFSNLIQVNQTFTHLYRIRSIPDLIPLYLQSTVRKIESGWDAFAWRDRFRSSESYVRQMGNKAVRKYLIRSRRAG